MNPALLASINGSRLSKSHKAVLRELARLHEKHGGAPLNPSIYRLASKLDLSDSTVRLAFRKLTELGVLKLVGQLSTGNHPSVYRFCEQAVDKLWKSNHASQRNRCVKRSPAKSLGGDPVKSLGNIYKERTATCKRAMAKERMNVVVLPVDKSA
jgi:DNA-binding transcriptional ArsR family regulator